MTQVNRSVRSFRNLTIFAFLLFCTLSVGFIISATMNYNHFWEAKSKLTATLDEIRLVTDPNTGNVSSVETRVSVANPTAYNGLTLNLVQAAIFFVNNDTKNTIFFYSNIVGSTNPFQSLSPGSNITSTVTIQLTKSESQTLSNQTRQMPPPPLIAHVIVTVLVDSFFDPVSGKLQRIIVEEIPV